MNATDTPESSARAADALPPCCRKTLAVAADLTAMGRRLDRSVREHPWRALAITGIFAYLLGRIRKRP